MKVAFDGACLGDGPITGVGRAFLNGLEAYRKAERASCVLLLPTGAPDPGLVNLPVVEAPRGALRRQLALPGLLRRLGADLLHSSVAAVPLRADCATVATVHDLPWLHAELGEPSDAWRRFATRRSLRSAAAIVCPSSFTRDDIAAWLGSTAPPIDVIPHGTRRCERPLTGARHGPLLALGDDRPRKNRERLRQAHALAQAQAPELPPLRFVGPPHDYVTEAEKLQLLRTCRAVVQVSLFEGFGMPVLEAMSQAAPLVCADLAPFRELAQHAALFVDPRDPAAIAAALVRVLDASLAAELAEQGWQRAGAFTAERTAELWHALHQRLVRR